MNDSNAAFHPRAQRSSIALGIAIALLSPCLVHAQGERSVAELEAEVARLQQLLEQKRQAQVTAELEAAAAEASAPEAQTIAASASGDAPIEGVVVVGDREVNRREELKDTPLSVSVVTGEELDRELSLDLNSMTRRSASIQFNQNNTRGASLSIRGLGRRSFTETQDPSVGLTVDGVSYGLTQLGNFDFFDIDTVEVRRGPQGTLGGKEASAGSVNIVTRRPSFERSADFSLTAGQRDSLLAKATFGGTLLEDLVAWRGSFIADRGRGFYQSAYDPNYSFYNKNRFGGRVQLLVTPPTGVDRRLRGGHQVIALERRSESLR
jgi:iron complex outermembrane recepter protein